MLQGPGKLLQNGGRDGETGGPADGLPGPHRGCSRPAADPRYVMQYVLLWVTFVTQLDLHTVCVSKKHKYL